MVSKVVYATPKDLRARLGQDATDDDTVLTALLTAVSRMWDNYCNRHAFGFKATNTATARIYPGTGKAWLNIEECIEITAVAVKDSITDTAYQAWASTDWIGYRGSYRVPNFNDLPITSVMILASGAKSLFLDGEYNSSDDLPHNLPTVQVTARWGYADDVPELIREATIAQAQIMYKRGKGSWADVLRDSEFGEERFVRVLDPTLKLLVESGRLVRRTGLN